LISIYFGQATQAPNNGASNAQDFQPQTRNPQTAPANLQPGTGSAQETSPQDILSRQNTRINVTSNPAPPPQAQSVQTGGINWGWVVISTVVIVAVLYYILTLRDRRKASLAETEVLPEAPSAGVESSAAEASAAEPVPAKTPKATAAAVKSKKSKKKKSKSKRKHR
jgi:hypothetical protein